MAILAGMGGFFGAILRYLLGKWISDAAKTSYPLGTWIINLSGSFLLGLISFYFVEQMISIKIWMFFGTGFLGAYTTFSTFGYETIQLIAKKQWHLAIFYIITTIILGLFFAWIGAITGKFIIQK